MTAIYTEFTTQFMFINTVVLVLYWHALQKVFIPLLFTNLWDVSPDWMKITPVGFNVMMSAKLPGVYLKNDGVFNYWFKNVLMCFFFFQVLKNWGQNEFSVVCYCQLPFHCLLIAFRSEKNVTQRVWVVDADVQYALRENHRIHMTGFITLRRGCLSPQVLMRHQEWHLWQSHETSSAFHVLVHVCCVGACICKQPRNCFFSAALTSSRHRLYAGPLPPSLSSGVLAASLP